MDYYRGADFLIMPVVIRWTFFYLLCLKIFQNSAVSYYEYCCDLLLQKKFELNTQTAN